MNFFEHQERARRQSRWLIIAFIAVVILIVLAIDALVLVYLAMDTSQGGDLGSVSLWKQNAPLLLASSAITAGVICLSSFGKIVSLRSGGGKVARDMGATIVTPDTRDPLRRRYYNVVEEIAIASGTPVPEVFVMENEPGINAFAAGYTPADAAIAVTQGTLEKLDRSELQGVVAHEFSHIFNGDMRINIRMMGVIFGITVIAILGRKFLSSQRYRSRSSRDNAGAAIAIGFALMAIGSIGLFFARWMKSALSRQREYLADASAVQFTREPDGISGALKKIAAFNHSSYLKSDSEEVSHMLFGSGSRSLMFATHPPLVDRIKRIEKNFNASELDQLANKLRVQEKREHVQAEKAAQEQADKSKSKGGARLFDVGSIIENIGNPEFERILAATMLSAELPDSLTTAAHSLEWAPEVLFFCLLDPNEDIRQKQLLIVIEQMGDISEGKLRHLISANDSINPEQRLPLLEVCFPALKRRPIDDVEKILDTINLLVMADNKIDTFEYLLSRMVSNHLYESNSPSRVRLHGKLQLKNHREELSTVVSILASHGQLDNGAQGLQLAQHAYRAGMESIDIKHTNLQFSDDWQVKLDKALKILDKLTPSDKSKLVNVLATTVANDGALVTEEHEMFRAICSLLHVPLPILQKGKQS